MEAQNTTQEMTQSDLVSSSPGPIEIRKGGTDTAHTGSNRIERVFPIRVSHVQKAREEQKPPGLQSAGEDELSFHSTTQHTLPVLLRSDQESQPPSVHTLRLSEATPSSFAGQRYITNKFTYVPGGDSVSAMPSTAAEKTYRCEDEPIHIPGAIQRIGALIAVREEDKNFIVRIVSENSGDVTGFEPEVLFRLQCFTDLLTLSERTEFVIRAHALYSDTTRTSPDVFSISLAARNGTRNRLFCAMHFNKESNLVICELEADQGLDAKSLQARNFPCEPIQIIHNEATDAERLLSTTSRSKPLHSLQIASASARQLTLMDSFQILLEIQSQLASTDSLSQLFDVIVGLVHDLTGFHRVMVYRFDDTSAGSVVSELIDPRASKDLYRGLHFPASDIPKQARELYMINTMRILYDREEDTARLICRALEDTKTPLDLSHSYLRAMSPIHMRYLANMRVQASMSISLIVEGKLWGLISCHNYGPGSGIRVSLPTREICRGLGNIASSNIQKLLFSSRVAARRPLSNTPPKASPFTYITSSSSDLLNMFGADFGFLVIKGEARTIGQLFAYREAIVLLQYIRQRSQPSIFYSHAIREDFPDLDYNPDFSTISGMLVIPLSLSGTDFLVFFRKGKLKELKWAGNPYEKQVASGTQYLEPRSSFKRWSETVIGTSREWTEDEVESAAVLTTLYGRFIEVWRQKEAIVQRNRMTRLLIRNAGHEVRTPLNSIINYLEVALEEELDERARYHLQRSLTASKSLVFVVNDLLHLTEAEESDFQVHEDNVNLRSMISEVVTAFRDEAKRRNLNINILDDKDVPQQVRCDPGGLRQVISNLLSNSLQNSAGRDVEVGLEHVQTTQSSSTINILFADHGTGLSEEQLDCIFQDFEQILDDDESSTPGEESARGKALGPLRIGLGLATVAKFVRVHSGQISMSSEGKDKGTKVTIMILFRKALSGDFSRRRLLSDIALHTPPSPPSDILLSTASKTPGSASSSSTQPAAFDLATSPSSPESSTARYPFPNLGARDDRSSFNVLYAEDNPLNSRLLETRLRKRGHSVRIAVDGQACIDVFRSSPHEFDIILMDIQMPLVGGIEATRMIRDLEKQPSSPISLSPRVVPYGRIPIVAVSASLSEHRVREYIDTGFDGWILKPIDFKRLEAILRAVEDEKTREILYYGEGNWEKGGWFHVGN